MTDQTRIAIVTGGSRGLGRATVLALAARGVRSIFTYKSSPGEAETVVRLAKEAGGEAKALALDTSDVSVFDTFAQDVRRGIADWGRDSFDYLVNNAGTSHNGGLADTTEADLDALYAVHVKGVFFLTQKLVPLIADGGRIINLSTGLTRFTHPGRAAYAAMKGAVEVLTRYMAKELGPRRITVNVVAPGAIQTDFSGGIVRDNPQVNKLVADATALGRPGLPDDIGPMIAALLSDENRWVNAQRIEVSGGQSI